MERSVTRAGHVTKASKTSIDLMFFFEPRCKRNHIPPFLRDDTYQFGSPGLADGLLHSHQAEVSSLPQCVLHAWSSDAGASGNYVNMQGTQSVRLYLVTDYSQHCEQFGRIGQPLVKPIF